MELTLKHSYARTLGYRRDSWQNADKFGTGTGIWRRGSTIRMCPARYCSLDAKRVQTWYTGELELIFYDTP